MESLLGRPRQSTLSCLEDVEIIKFSAVDLNVKEEGAAALLSGLSARVFWISLGGFLFFGAYDAATSQLKKRGV